jgi:hypothetical protein
MSGGFLIALDRGLYIRVAAALSELGAVTARDDLGGGVVQLADDAGRLFTLYERIVPGTEWELREGPFTPAKGVRAPDMLRVTACPFECRWSDLVARIANVAARTVEAPTWLLDSDGTVWNADSVDPTEVHLN